MSIFGWCATNFHAHYEGEWSQPCKGQYRKVIKNTQKRGRKTIETVLVDEMVYCDCWCHKPKDEWPKAKRPKPAKKTTTRRKK